MLLLGLVRLSSLVLVVKPKATLVCVFFVAGLALDDFPKVLDLSAGT